MIDVQALKAIIVLRGFTMKDVAEHLHMHPKTFYDKMKKGVFGSDEMEAMIDFLEIEEPLPVFFPNFFRKKVTC